MTYPPSPLRWLGGKSRAVKHILPYIPTNGLVVSPFLGGGSVELALAAQGIPVYGSDIDSRLINLWQCLIEDAPRVRRLVEMYLPADKEVFEDLKTRLDADNPFVSAARYWYVNRCAVNGLNSHFAARDSLAGGDQKGLSPHLIVKPPSALHVECMDYRDALDKHPDKFAYLDPPYVGVDYYAGEVWDDADHAELASVLRDRESPWLLSYGDHPRIRELYEGCLIVPRTMPYASRHMARKGELLITAE